MKKENKKLAQKRRAEERKKQAKKNIIAKVCQIGLPSLLLIALIVICIANPFDKSDSSTNVNDTATESTNSNDTTTADTTLSTDASLTVENGNTINIDYVGSIDGVEFAGGNTNGAGADLVIGSGTYIDDFEEQLIGAHPGDEVEVNVTFPENYGNEELKGKDALFKVVVNGIYK